MSKTYLGIELVHFCTNDNAKAVWKSYGLGHSSYFNNFNIDEDDDII